MVWSADEQITVSVAINIACGSNRMPKPSPGCSTNYSGLRNRQI